METKLVFEFATAEQAGEFFEFCVAGRAMRSYRVVEVPTDDLDERELYFTREAAAQLGGREVGS